jgi:hypothetical protein
VGLQQRLEARKQVAVTGRNAVPAMLASDQEVVCFSHGQKSD